MGAPASNVRGFRLRVGGGSENAVVTGLVGIQTTLWQAHISGQTGQVGRGGRRDGQSELQTEDIMRGWRWCAGRTTSGGGQGGFLRVSLLHTHRAHSTQISRSEGRNYSGGGWGVGKASKSLHTKTISTHTCSNAVG